LTRILRAALFIARSDARYLLRQRETQLWTFVMPVVFFYFIGTVTSGGGAAPAAGPAPIALVAPENAGFLAGELADRLGNQGFEVERTVKPGPETPSRRVLVPDGASGLSDSVAAGERPELIFEPGGRGLTSDYDELRVARAVWGLAADIAVLRHEGRETTPAALRELGTRERSIALEVQTAGRRRRAPSGFEQAIPGTLVMFTMMILLTGGSTMLVTERQQGLLRRLASAPISRGAVVLGKWGARMVLGLTQVLFGALAGTLLFGMRWGDALPAVAGILFCWAAFNASLSLFVGVAARTMGQVLGGGILASMLLAALGGCWWPIEITPEWMQTLSLFLPTGWAMDALHRLVSFGHPGTSVTAHALGLLAGAFGFGALAARYFRYQ